MALKAKHSRADTAAGLHTAGMGGQTPEQCALKVGAFARVYAEELLKGGK